MDADFGIVDFHLIHDRPDISAAEGCLPGQDVRAHDIDEGGDLFLGDPLAWIALGNGAIVAGLSNVALGADGSDPLLQGNYPRLWTLVFRLRLS